MRGTEIGRQFHFSEIKDSSSYAEAVPITDYETIQPSIERMMDGEKDVLVNGRVKWFAKSSGTTSARSKYIPVTTEFLYGNLIRSHWDATSIIYQNDPEAEIFKKKSLIMGGSLSPYKDTDVMVGDISAIMIDRMPSVGKPFYSPCFETALLEDWEEKIEKMSEECMKEEIVMCGGVPTWTIVLFDRILEKTGKKNIHEVWPSMKYYFHGGVGFGPYKEQFQKYFPDPSFKYFEVYNASEGYFAIQDDPEAEGMLLLTDNGIYYEFIPPDQWTVEQPQAIPLSEVKMGVNYAIVITNTAGLYRYTPGDTVQFTSISPYRIMVTGRTKHFINVFGEEVMVGNTDACLSVTCKEVPALVRDYTVGPVYMEKKKQGGHIWLIEFEKAPEDLSYFAARLDSNLRKINSDYDAKRSKDIALRPLQIQQVPKGTFHRWLKSRGKIGGQTKVPRLSNDRHYVEELLAIRDC